MHKALQSEKGVSCQAVLFLQARGITMKSSSISLLHLGCGGGGGGGRVGGGTAQPSDTSERNGGEGGVAQLTSDRADRGVLINLIDSPGHVDFCSEVGCPCFCIATDCRLVQRNCAKLSDAIAANRCNACCSCRLGTAYRCRWAPEHHSELTLFAHRPH